MSIIDAIILGVIQGLTEFLPISSSGHLTLMQKILKVNGNNIALDIALHVGSLIAVIFIFKKEIWYLIRHPFCELAKKLYIATIPTVIMVIIFKKFIEGAFGGDFFITGFSITGVVLVITEFIASKKRSTKPISYGNAILMGIAQGFATLPGISRSGATICAGLIQGNNREECAKFSFLMSIPIILASMIYTIIFDGGINNLNLLSLFIGMASAFISGLIAIKFMMKLIKNVNFIWFVLYLTIVVGIYTVIMIF